MKSKGGNQNGNQAGRPTAAELERRKARVMEVATDLFVSHGYAATSLVDIARGAGVATRTLYQHFGDKEAIFREVIFARDHQSVVPPPVLNEEDSLFSALVGTANYACRVAFQDRSVELMRLMVAESNRFPELMKKVANATFVQFRRRIASIFVELAEYKTIPEDDHALSGDLFVDLILGNAPIMMYTKWATEWPTTEEIERKVELFILGRFGPAVARRAHKQLATSGKDRASPKPAAV